MRKLATTVASVLALAGFAASSATAANPPGTGQPGAPTGVSCPSPITSTTTPKGFNTGGFANASGVYANPGTTSGSGHAVSQYDIACYQTSQTH